MSETKQKITCPPPSHGQSIHTESVQTSQDQQLTAEQLLKKLQELGATASFLSAARKTLGS